MYILNYILGKYNDNAGFKNGVSNILHATSCFCGKKSDTCKYKYEANNSFLLCLEYISFIFANDIDSKQRSIHYMIATYNKIFEDGCMPPFSLPSLMVNSDEQGWGSIVLANFWDSESDKYKKLRRNIYKKCIDFIVDDKNAHTKIITQANNRSILLVIETENTE